MCSMGTTISKIWCIGMLRYMPTHQSNSTAKYATPNTLSIILICPAYTIAWCKKCTHNTYPTWIYVFSFVSSYIFHMDICICFVKIIHHKYSSRLFLFVTHWVVYTPTQFPPALVLHSRVVCFVTTISSQYHAWWCTGLWYCHTIKKTHLNEILQINHFLLLSKYYIFLQTRIKPCKLRQKPCLCLLMPWLHCHAFSRDSID